MSTNLLGQTWEHKAVGNTPSGPIIEYSNKEIGVFYVSHGASYELRTCEFEKVLSAIYQIMLDDKNLLICLESEKAAFSNTNLKAATLREVYLMFPSTIVEKQYAILKTLYKKNPNIGEIIEVADFQPYMFYSKNNAEMGYILELMNRKQLITKQVHWTAAGQAEFSLPLKIEEKGWLLLEDIIQQENSNNVFVAMWFDPSMDATYLAIKDAVNSLGFDSLRIDKKEHNNEISGEILYEIRKCRFLIADVTNQRHGVYFEAGYAIGKGIPVIWTCKKTDLPNVHFDTRQYSHVVWENESELKDRLLSRIRGTILK